MSWFNHDWFVMAGAIFVGTLPLWFAAHYQLVRRSGYATKEDLLDMERRIQVRLNEIDKAFPRTHAPDHYPTVK